MAEERVWTTAEYTSTANFTVHDGVMTVRRVGRISRLIFFSIFRLRPGALPLLLKVFNLQPFCSVLGQHFHPLNPKIG